MKKNLLLLLLSFVAGSAFAQDFPYAQLDNAALEMKNYAKDTSAHSVIINEHGSARITVTGLDEIRLVYEYHTKIKFFDTKDFASQGTIEIPIYSGDSEVYENVTDIAGTTFYKDDNGLVQKVELDPKKVFRIKDNNHWSTVKFAMPGLKSGCIIDVKYRVESPYIYLFHSWQFQDRIPKMYSEYEVHIPGFWDYNASLRGNLKLTTNKSEVERECFAFHGSNSDCSHMVYGIKDIPAFIEEDDMTSPKNFTSAVYFELQQYTDLSTGSKIKVSKEWRDLDYTLKTEPSFGSQLKRKELLKDKITPVITGKTDTIEKAKAVYTFIQKSFKWNEMDDFASPDGIRKAFDSHTGNSGDINLSLVTALNAAGIPAQAVLLSTRAHGAINKLYPGLGDFNYVIARTVIGNKAYLLDATDPLLSFGMLPLRCINDQGRVFSLDKASYWIDMNTPQRENTTYTFDLTLQDNGKLKGTMIRYSSGYSGYQRRKEIKKFNSVDEYVENLDEKLPKLKILKSNISNIDSLDSAVGETYEVEIDFYNNLNHERLGFNPFLWDRITNNPYKLAERDFPVDRGMPSNERYMVTLHLPSQYSVEDAPQNVSFAMPNQGGRFLTSFESDNNIFTFSYVTQLNKSVYSPEEYPYLKELFNKIILSEKHEMVFKKKS